jgi:hemolysin activation/secretion protein
MYAGNGKRRLLAVAGTGFLPIWAAAAAPPTPPTPGAIGDTLKQPPALQRPAPAPGISVPQSQAPAASGQGASIVVSHFEFSGNTIYGEDALQPLVAEYLGHPISLGQLYEAADKVAEFYSRNGYALASVNVPAQKVKDGTVRLEVLEGRIGKVGFDGNHGYHDAILGGYVSHISPKQVYRNGPLDQDLQQLNALPGLSARAVIKPGEEYGTSDVTVKVQEKPIEGYAVIDNYGRKDSGENRISASVTLNNPGGISDQLQVLGTHSGDDRLNYGYFDYSLPVNFDGTRLDMNFGHAYFKTAVPGVGATPATAVDGKNNNLQLTLIQPFLRTATDTLIGQAGYIHTDANADLFGFSLSDTTINLLHLNLSYAHVWADSAATQYTLDLHSNFGDGRVSHPDREVMRTELNIQHLQPLPAHLQLLAQFDGVYSPRPLADTEQLSIGGPTSVRGFPSSEARGSSGYFTQLTLRRPFAAGPVSLVPRVFADTGLVRHLNYFGLGQDSDDSLTSAGLGFDAIYRTVDLKVDWSYPLDSTPVSDGRDDGRVYASLTAGF